MSTQDKVFPRTVLLFMSTPRQSLALPKPSTDTKLKPSKLTISQLLLKSEELKYIFRKIFLSSLVS